jgi:anion-transporting  ArsA/GET3 family ATPase
VQSLAQIIAEKRVIVVVGAGGVGKTTLSAAIGVAAARLGRRTLVLTVDPARRLASALGLASFDENVQRIPVADFAAQHCVVAAPLDAAMLDVKRTFDRVVTRYAKSPESREAILNHPFYRQASTTLAGTQEYMAMERLYESATSGQWDLIVLDTPPSAHALDFLDAPDRLVGLFDSRAFQLLLKPTQKLRTGPFRAGSVVMRGLSRFTSVEMFSELLQFFSHLSDTFEGFVDGARRTQALLRGADTSFVLVSACDATSTEEARYLRKKLDETEMHAATWIVNRVAPFPTSVAHAGPELEAQLEQFLLEQGPEAIGGDARQARRTAKLLAEAARRLGSLAQADARVVETVRGLANNLQVLPVPRAPDEPDSLVGLHRMTEALLDG